MADNDELARWRAQRMAQMQQQQSGPTPQQMEQQRKKEEADKERRHIILNQVMTAEAREKLSNIRLVKPQRAEHVENYIINAAQSGALPGKITEEQVKDILRRYTEQTQKATKVTIMRRRRAFEDEFDDDDDDF